MEKKPCRRRWLQFSLRTFLIVLTLFALWLGWWVDRMRRQQAAIETILTVGNNQVHFDYEVDSRAKRPSVPKWLRDTFGDVYFRSVVQIEIGGDLAVLKDLPYVRNLSLSGPQLTDADLVHLKSLRNLERLHLRRTYGISDDGMRHLAKLHSLRELDFSDTRITDAGLLHLKGLQNLELLYLDVGAYTAKGILELQEVLPNLEIPGMDIRPRALSEEEAVADLAKVGVQFVAGDTGEVLRANLIGPQITDETIAHLDALTALEHVALVGTQVTHEALQALRIRRPELEVFAPCVFEPHPEEAEAVAKLKRLGTSLYPNDHGFVVNVEICEYEVPIEDGHLELIAGFSQLERLEVDASEISGAGLKCLTECGSLSAIRIVSSRITDEDLSHLQKLKQLKSLGLSFARVNGSGLARLTDLDKLENLNLMGNPLKDQYLKHLNVFPALRRVNFDRTPISDAGMNHLASCADLEVISLQYTKVTDQGVVLLLGLEKLKNVFVMGTKVSDAMGQRLPKHTTRLRGGLRPGNLRPKDSN